MSLTGILIIFLLAAGGGATMAYMVLKDKKRPLFLVAAHGFFALAGFALLAFTGAHDFETSGNKGTPNASIAFFAVAIAGGIYMFFRDKYQKKKLEKWMPFVHGSAALLGIIFLVLFMMH